MLTLAPGPLIQGCDGRGKRRVWTVGGLSHDDGAWTVTKARELAEDEFAELERKVAFVVDLASQGDYGRLLAAVRRFDALLATTREELETEGRLSLRSAAALPLDLAAVAEAARRLETALAEKIDAAADLPQQLATRFHDVRDGIRASRPYLLAYEFARRASSGRCRHRGRSRRRRRHRGNQRTSHRQA